MTTSMSAEQTTEHLSGYQNRDWKIVDYHMYEHGRSGLSFRGPAPALVPGEYATCLGAAQTLGCFCRTPFPEILHQKLNIEFVNFGYGGAGPRFYLRHPELLEVVNRGRFAIVQVMSGRSEDNRLFQSNGLEYLVERASGRRLSADEAYRRLLEQHSLDSIPAPAARVLRMFHAPEELRAVLRETRDNWLASYQALFAEITVPIILLWFSKRSPGLHRGKKLVWWWQRYDNVHAMFGKFPQLVNSQMMRVIAPEAAHYVECVSSRGSPQRLIDRFTGEPTTINTSDDRPDFTGVWSYNAYYPSPEMHEDAADLLEPVCRKLLS
ncbi:DUF6473 family protein [Paracoccus sp. MBLB3053]|uniref:DUF6473 family protein n=1 Tax=Paracoccus aurantius TaxID=3073814 RepID=A0ABU2HV74_9RHOB|nr:DUF6473 family protein [Paracoccus sp. MBLB3053]MDS9468936.1 DUF6473 family protein [Paracoccus sp. MBLB3053]